MSYQVEYIPTIIDLYERSFAIAKDESLIDVYASCKAAVNETGVLYCNLCLQAWYRKPGSNSNDMGKANHITISGKFADSDLLFDRFKDAVDSMKKAYAAAA